MKKIILCICLGLSLFGESSCDTYLKQADDARIELEKILVQDSIMVRDEKVKIFLMYIEILQDRYLICRKYGS